jgi:hypothetical protein
LDADIADKASAFSAASIARSSASDIFGIGVPDFSKSIPLRTLERQESGASGGAVFMHSFGVWFVYEIRCYKSTAGGVFSLIFSQTSVRPVNISTLEVCSFHGRIA